MNLTTVQWRKSSYSGDQGGNCVEVVDLPHVIALRDSKSPAGPCLIFSRGEWRAFLREIKQAE